MEVFSAIFTEGNGKFLLRLNEYHYIEFLPSYHMFQICVLYQNHHFFDRLTALGKVQKKAPPHFFMLMKK